jgi:asparagine synthase (glutamine-hydrolysing)
MCGIVGFLAPGGDSGEFSDTILSMLGAIAHRGPDGVGYLVDDRGAIGVTRLSIIDAALGTQPMCDRTGRYWICYNGEVYNYRELRAELEQRGCAFRTQSDTEVVLQAWIAWGEASLARLNGGFAFVIYDREAASLALVRDQFGKRPLFYCQRDGAFLFASEMKAFRPYPGFAFEQDPQQLSAILAQWTPLPDQTGFVGISSLPMGEWLQVTADGLTRRRYASLSFEEGPAVGSEDEAIALIRERLRDSVALRLRSDVDVGVYLSGGLDSAIVAGLAGDMVGRPLSTFSITFDDRQFDESPEQLELAARLGTRHTALRVTPGDISRNFPEAIFHAEIPAFRSAFVPMFLLSKRTREAGIKVVLSGEGADEAFLGYDLFKETTLRTNWRNLDDDERRRQLTRLYPHLDHYGPKDIAAITGLYQQFSEERMPGLFSHELRFQNGRFSARLIRSAGDPFGPIARLVAQSPGFAGLTPVQKAQWLEYQTLLPGYLLSTQGDRMSMAHGVENRCPFLDRSVFDLAAAVNLRFDDGFEEKRLLRRAFRDELPASIVEKRKFPYRAPDAEAFAASPPDYLELLLSDAELSKLPFLDRKFARALTTKVLSRDSAEVSTKENQTFIFLLSIALLRRAFVGREAAGDTQALPPLVRCVDMRRRPGLPAGHVSQGNLSSVM